MSGLADRVRREPVAFGVTLQAVLGALVALHAVRLDADQLAYVVVAVNSVIGFLVRASVTPISEADEKVQNAAHRAATHEREQIHAYLSGAARRTPLRAPDFAPDPKETP